VTDDVIEQDGEGFRLLGRADSIVKVGGKRFSTHEVVAAALAQPHVEQAVAVTFQRFDETAVALFVMPAAGAALAAPELRAALALRLAPFKLPRQINIVPELPLLANGKPDLGALRALAEHHRD
jgi:O-succinylbenzoic acid--CoA ligase